MVGMPGFVGQIFDRGGFGTDKAALSRRTTRDGRTDKKRLDFTLVFLMCLYFSP